MTDLINALPSYVLRMSDSVKGAVESSISLGLFSYCPVNGGSATLLGRSSVDSFLRDMNEQVMGICRLGGYKCEGWKDPAKGWTPNVNSKLLKSTVKYYAQALHKTEKEIKVEACHAGLECGELISLFPGMEAVSIGPTIANPHSPREWCVIEDIEPFYECVKNVILDL